MTDRTAARLARSALIVWFLMMGASIIFEIAAIDPGPNSLAKDIPFIITISTFPIVGAVILLRQPRNVIGWILAAIGLAWVAGGLPSTYGAFALGRGLPGASIGIALSEPSWAPPVLLMGTTLLLRFPDGRFLSPRWRWVERLALFAILAISVLILLTPGTFEDSGYPQVTNPFGVPSLKPVLEVVTPILLLAPITMALSAASLVIRFRRSTGVERMQMKWLTSAAGFLAAVFAISMLGSVGGAWGEADTPAWLGAVQELAALCFGLIPISIGFAVMKHRLYDIDVVINKALVYGSLAVTVSAVYVVVVVGVGALIAGGEPNLALSIAATAIVALLFEPVRARLQRFANRVVYGARATPYDVIQTLARRLSESYPTHETLERIARALSEGTGARVDVWLRADNELRPAVSWPEGASGLESVPVTQSPLPGDLAVPVEHDGEILGAITVRDGTRPLTTTEQHLVRDMAAQAGLVLRNVGLTTELLARLNDLRESRQRLVAAQDAERRTLERNLHDGAQQHIVALKIKLGIVAGVTQRPEIKTLVAELQQQVADALDDLRALSRGIYPPLLASDGLDAALRGLASRNAVPVEVEVRDVGRHAEQIEAAVYFCVVEALRGATKAVRIVVEADASALALRIDGVPISAQVEQNVTDRIAALDGSVRFEEESLRAEIPLAVKAIA